MIKLSNKNSKGLLHEERIKTLNMFKAGKTVKEIMEMKMDIGKKQLYNMKQNPIKYSLRKNDIK